MEKNIKVAKYRKLFPVSGNNVKNEPSGRQSICRYFESLIPIPCSTSILRYRYHFAQLHQFSRISIMQFCVDITFRFLTISFAWFEYKKYRDPFVNRFGNGFFQKGERGFGLLSYRLQRAYYQTANPHKK